jgi:signal transduction histidine kinase
MPGRGHGHARAGDREDGVSGPGAPGPGEGAESRGAAGQAAFDAYAAQIDPPPMRLPDWWRDIALAAGVAGIGIWEMARTPPWISQSAPDTLTVVLLLACGVGLYRRAPGTALLLSWLSGMVLLITSVDLLLVHLTAAVVAFGTARYGSALVVWLGGLSVPFAALLAVVVGEGRGLARFDLSVFFRLQPYGPGINSMLLLGTMAITILSLPWLIGLVLRLRQRAQRSREAGEAAQERQLAAEEARAEAEAERTHAEEIARLREDQASLARDVHDVVGHSLAVILAQAESAQFLPENDTARIQRTMANIATSARQSLRDVRQVLSVMADPDGSSRLPSGSPDSLLDDVRAAGSELHEEVTGTPRPLPAEQETVAFRVLQEMLTNALKHGRRGAPVHVERAWEDTALRIRVRNSVPPRPPGDAPEHSGGMGLNGMRGRLASVGGQLRVTRTPEEQPGLGEQYTATAWIPLAGRSGSA